MPGSANQSPISLHSSRNVALREAESEREGFTPRIENDGARGLQAALAKRPSLAALVLALLLSYLMTNRVLRPLSQMTRISRQLATNGVELVSQAEVPI